MEVNEQIPQPGTVWLLLGKNKDSVDIGTVNRTTFPATSQMPSLHILVSGKGVVRMARTSRC